MLLLISYNRKSKDTELPAYMVLKFVDDVEKWKFDFFPIYVKNKTKKRNRIFDSIIFFFEYNEWVLGKNVEHADFDKKKFKNRLNANGEQNDRKNCHYFWTLIKPGRNIYPVIVLASVSFVPIQNLYNFRKRFRGCRRDGNRRVAFYLFSFLDFQISPTLYTIGKIWCHHHKCLRLGRRC